MQRILSVETSRCGETNREFVSKRLCISLLFSIAFFTLLAGYLLGRYTTQKTVTLKKKIIQDEIQTDKLKSLDAVFTKVYNNTQILCVQQNFFCNFSSMIVSGHDEFQKTIPLECKKVVENELQSLETCYESINNLLERFLGINKTKE